MKNISRFKVDKGILLAIIIFAIISIITIYSAQGILAKDMQNLYTKQIMWYGIGFIVAYIIMFIGNDFIVKHINILYIIGVLLLGLVLIFGATINEAKCWFVLPGIGNFQPSEFMKIILILMEAKMIDKFHGDNDSPTPLEEFKFLVKILVVVAIPALLTFLEPDTGVVLIYLLITFIMLFISGFRFRWFLIVIGGIVTLVGGLLAIYFLNKELFIKIFGTSFFLRIDRLLDWSNGSGYQLKNGMTAIASGNIFGNGFNNTPIYFPYPQTDFIFAVFASNFGLVGSVFLIGLIVYFDIKLITTAIHSNKKINKYIIAGIIGMLIYQQFQNIGMTIGIMPITGITLPFISYGGSSLLSYMLMLGFIFNISNETIKEERNK